MTTDSSTVDNYDEEELHVGDEGYAVNDGNHNDSEAHLDETHNENQLVDSKDDLQKKVYFGAWYIICVLFKHY